MSDIKDWSTTAADNNAAAPNGAPEGWAPSAVNNVVRENMRAVRAFYAAIEWREFGDNTGTNDCHTVAYASATTFTTAAGDGDTTGVYHAGRRIRAVGSSTGTIYGTIDSSTGNPTTVTVVWDSGSLSSEALTISLGPGVTGYPIGPLAVHTFGNATRIESQDASASSSIEFTSGIDSTYPLYVVRLENVRCSSDGDILGAQISQAATWITSGYKFHSSISLASTSSYQGTNSTSASLLGGMTNNQSSDADHSFSGFFYLPNPSGTVMLQKCYWWGSYIAADDDGVNVYGSGHYTTAAAADRLRFKYNTGNITSGTFSLYGIS